MGLRLRLILVVTIPLVLVLGGYGMFRVRAERAELLEDDRKSIALTARAAQVALEHALRDQKIDDVSRLLGELVEANDGIDRIRIFDRDLRPTLTSSSGGFGEGILTETLRTVIGTGVAQAVYRRERGQSVLVHVAPIRRPNGEVRGAMEVLHRAVGVEARVAAATREVWLRLILVVGAVALVTAVLLQRQVLDPLGRLLDGIQRLGRGEPGPALPVERPDDLGRVAAAFNEMAEQLTAARARLLAETQHAVDLERQLRRAATVAVAGKLASGLAHEVGTPLNIISGRAEVLMAEFSADDPRHADLAAIVAQIDRISGIIRSLLDVVRPQRPELRLTALDATIDRILPLLNHTAVRRGVELSRQLPADLPPVLADPNHLQQVLINLVVNALDVTPAEGRVEVVAERLIKDGRGGVALWVRDTGPGFAPDVVARVFEPFFTTKPRGQGTGLGLSTSRDLVRQLGGDMWVENQPGTGASVGVWLPQAPGEPPAAERAA